MDPDLLHLGRLEGLGHEIGEVLGERDDVDLLATELVDNHADAGAARADAGADRIDVLVVGPDGDLGAVPGLAGAGLDLHDAVGDLGDLELEQALDQPGVGATDHDLRALGGLADLDDVGLEAAVGLGALVGHLLGLRQQRLHPAEVQQGVAGIGLLDDAGDDVSLAPGVLLVLHLPVDLAQALHHDLLEGLGGDPAEGAGVWGDVELGAESFAVVVELLRGDAHLAGDRVDGGPGVLVGAGQALVGRLQCVGERAHQGLGGDALLGGEGPEGFHHVVVAHDFAAFFLTDGEVSGPGLGPPGLGAGPHSKIVRARSMSS